MLLTAAPTVLASELIFSFAFHPEEVSLEQRNGFLLPHLANADAGEQPPGSPWLPAKWVNVLLPSGAEDVTIDYQASETELFSGVTVFPAQPPAPLSQNPPAFVPPDPVLYASATPFPSSVAELGELHQMRENTFVSVRLNPMRYRPDGGVLSLATSLTVIVRYATPRRTAEAAPPANALFSDIVSDLVINPPSPAPTRRLSDEQPAAEVDYLIITSASLSNAFQKLAAHRASYNGMTTRILTTEYIASAYSGTRPDGGSDLQTRIRNCISNHVASCGTAYVLLGGDNTIVPDRDCYVTCVGYTESAMPTDLYYGGLNSSWDENRNGVYGEANYSGTLDEGDLAFDVIVGRIPVRTVAQATNYIGKSIRHDLRASPTLFSQRLTLGGDTLWNSYTGDSRPSDTVSDGYSEFQSHSPVADDEIWCRRMYRDGIRVYVPTNILPYFYDTLTSWDSATPGDYQQNATTLAARFNQGWNHVYFATHGNTTIWGLESGSFGTSAAAALTNKTALVYTMACLTGAFDQAEPSLSEAFLRNARGGAMAYMGCSRYGWGSPGSSKGGTSMEYAYEFYKQVYYHKQTHIGQAFAEHKLARIAYCGGNGSARWVQFGMNLQGDPLTAIHPPEAGGTSEAFWFQAIALTNSVMLRWNDPTQCGMASRIVQVRYRTDDYPTDVSDGSLAYQGTDCTYEHTGRMPGVSCYYTIWVSDDGETFVDPP